MIPDVAVSYTDPFSDPAREFADELSAAGMPVETEQRREEVLAASEWLFATGVVLFFARKYFDTILAEAAKEHYSLLKRAVTHLVRSLSGYRRITSASSPHKVDPTDPPGMISVYYVLAPGASLKFVFEAADDLAEISIEPLFDRLAQLSTAPEVTPEAVAGLPRTVIFRFDCQTGQWRPWDVRTKTFVP